MAVVYLAIGSNVGDSKKHIFAAQKLLLSELDCAVCAPLYISKAVGYTDQPDFTNTAVSGQTKLEPEALLEFVKGIENSVGRTKTFRWGPRELDIDIIFYDDTVQDSAKLTIPHPRFSERDFVLRPICDLCPELTDPKSKQTVKVLLAELPPENQSIFN